MRGVERAGGAPPFTVIPSEAAVIPSEAAVGMTANRNDREKESLHIIPANLMTATY